MQSTGIIRRIDELGRVVIPKELRRALNIRSGSYLEIFCEDGRLVLAKFSELRNVGDHFRGLAEAVAKGTGDAVAICDNENFLVCVGRAAKPLEGKPISAELSRRLAGRKEDWPVRLTAENDGVAALQVVFPIEKNGERFGGCVLLSENGGHRALLESYAETLAAFILGLLYE